MVQPRKDIELKLDRRLPAHTMQLNIRTFHYPLLGIPCSSEYSHIPKKDGIKFEQM